jgi:hypothetical protein
LTNSFGRRDCLVELLRRGVNFDQCMMSRMASSLDGARVVLPRLPRHGGAWSRHPDFAGCIPLVLHHSGSGTTLPAGGAGIPPVVLLPFAGDQSFWVKHYPAQAYRAHFPQVVIGGEM